MTKTIQHTLTYHASEICVSVREITIFNIEGELVQQQPLGYTIYPEQTKKIAALPDLERQQVINHFANNPIRVAARVALNKKNYEADVAAKRLAAQEE